MSIRIDQSLCSGCGRCVNICPGSLLERNSEGKAAIRLPRDCWGCTSCVKECPAGAISLYLGADIGGMGSELTVREHGDQLIWTVKKAGCVLREITVDRRASNQY